MLLQPFWDHPQGSSQNLHTLPEDWYVFSVISAHGKGCGETRTRLTLVKKPGQGRSPALNSNHPHQNYHSPWHSGAQDNKFSPSSGAEVAKDIPREGLDVGTWFGCTQTNPETSGPNSYVWALPETLQTFFC